MGLGVGSLASLQASCEAMARAEMFVNHWAKFPIASPYCIRFARPSLLSWVAVFERGAELALSWGSPKEVEIKLKQCEDNLVGPLRIAEDQVGPPLTICVAALLQVLRGRLSSKRGLICALKLLESVLLDFPEACSCVQMAGGVNILLELLKTTTGPLKVRTSICLALVTGAVNSHVDVIKYGGIPILTKSLEQAAVREHCMHALANMAPRPEVWNSTCTTEVIPHLVAALSASSKILQSDAVRVLGNLLTNCPHVCAEFVLKEGVQPLVALLKDRGADAEAAAADAISHLVVETCGARAVLSAGAVIILVVKLLEHREGRVMTTAVMSLAALVYSLPASANAVQLAGGVPLHTRLKALAESTKPSDEMDGWIISPALQSLLGLAEPRYPPCQKLAVLLLEKLPQADKGCQASIGPALGAPPHTVRHADSSASPPSVQKRPAANLSESSGKRRAT